jgi:Trm5-related predicted tRNA methylase
MHDPVTPMVAQAARVGWEAKKRRVDLTIERSFSGEELIKRMKGWVTTDPYKVIEVVKPYAKMKVLDDRELVLELEREDDLEKLNLALRESFGGEVDAEMIVKKR